LETDALKRAASLKKEILEKVKKFGTEIEIEIDGKVFTAELLWLCAPKTCEQVLSLLPIDHTKSVDGGMIHSCSLGWTMLVRWPKSAVPITVPPENHQSLLKEGHCYWKTYEEPVRDERFEKDLNEFFICYRMGYTYGPQGLDPLNEFARITDNLDELAAIGDKLYSKTVKVPISIRRKC